MNSTDIIMAIGTAIFIVGVPLSVVANRRKGLPAFDTGDLWIIAVFILAWILYIAGSVRWS